MKKIEILYIHGFGSKYNPNSEKIKHLLSIGSVSGIDVDYTDPYKNIYDKIYEASIKFDILIGTSMGGYWAKTIADKFDMPYVGINPALNPKKTLKQYIGNHKNYNDEPYTLLESTINEYPVLNSSSKNGLILLDEADELLSSEATAKHFKSEVVMFKGGCHRFSHMKESLGYIDRHYTNSITST